eukprot:EG_transcript_26343
MSPRMRTMQSNMVPIHQSGTVEIPVYESDLDFQRSLQAAVHAIVNKTLATPGGPETLQGQYAIISAKLTDIENQLTQIIRLVSRVECNFISINCQMHNHYARQTNHRLFDCPDALLCSIRKELPGHPACRPRGLRMGPQQVGADPPATFPRTLKAVRELKRAAIIDAMFWFYNDPGLAGGPGRSLSYRKEAVVRFLTQ